MKKILILTFMAVFTFTSLSFAGVLQQEWVEGTKRYCKYSDGQVIVVSAGSVCSMTN